MTVDASIVEWLKNGALFSSSNNAGIAAAWGSEAVETQIVSPLALVADAQVEAARQAGFLAGPLVIEKHDVPGLLVQLVGRPVTITADRLGYEAGLVVFVIGAEEAEATERTTLTVLRRLS